MGVQPNPATGSIRGPTMKNALPFAWLILLVCLACTQSVHATKRYAVASAAWNLNTTWAASSGGASGATFPVAGDTAYISEGGVARTVTLATGTSSACARIEIGSAASSIAGGI